MRPAIRWSLAAAALVATLAACGGSDPDVAPVATDTVAIRGFAYAPAHVEVTMGSTVTWANEDDAAHDVVFQGGTGRSELLSNGGSYRYTFARVGTFDYVCSLHSNMRGRVTVRDAA